MTHALAKGIMVHLGLDSAREGFVCVCENVCINTHPTSIKQRNFKKTLRHQLILRVDHVSSKRKKRH